MKKILALVLALALMLPLVGLAEEKPVVWSGTISVAPYMFGPYDESKDVAVHWAENHLKEKYGYDVKFEVVYIENANYAEIINTRIAGNTAPDIFKTNSDANLHKYYEQGAIASWDVEFFKENAPDLYEFLNNGGYKGRLKDSVDLFWATATADDGKMNNIPYFDEQSQMPSKTLMYRKDWLDKLGVTEDQLPTTIDDFVALMYRFANEDPDGNGVKDTYGCSASVIRAIFGAYGSSYDAQLWLDDGSGNLVNTDVMENNKAALELCVKLYADGVLDPEFVTGENNGGYWAVNHAFINGVIGASCHASIDHYRRPDVCGDNGGPVAIEWYAINGKDSDFVYAPWPAGPDGSYGLEIGNAVSVGSGHVLNAALNNDTEKMAAIFQIMNLFSVDDELMVRTVWGVENENYKVNEDGSFTSLTETAAGNEVGIKCLRGIYGPEKPYSEYGMFLDFYANPTILNRLNFFEKPQCDSYMRNAVTTLLPSQAEYQAELETLREETFVNIITGKVSLDSYDDYVQEWMDMGGDTLTAEANEWYADQK